MALTDPYCSVQEYRDRVDSSTDDDDAAIEAQLLASSRLIDRWCGRFFNKDNSVRSRIYDGGPGLTTFAMLWRDVSATPTGGKTRLYIPDDISTTTGLIVQVDLDGDYAFEQTLTIDTHFWIGPYNAAEGPEPWPYQFLDVVPNNNVMIAWPSHRRSVKVTAKFGWPSVPEAVRETCALLTREMRDLQKAGMVLSLGSIDTETRIVDRAPKIRENIIQQYGRARRPFS